MKMGGPDNTQTGNPKAPHLHPDCHFVASAFSAVINFPLWKASTIGQSGFVVQSNGILGKYIEALKPPYKGVGATIFGMTWARAAIFYGSDAGKNLMLAYGAPNSVATFFPSDGSLNICPVCEHADCQSNNNNSEPYIQD
mmetsp:Transcript_131010/g.298277  ORF Transcript_131010/g.298277 Transcript_131010/m.298277 type:complete len:140 (+) Transcript_131010:36-455(+)